MDWSNKLLVLQMTLIAQWLSPISLQLYVKGLFKIGCHISKKKLQHSMNLKMGSKKQCNTVCTPYGG